MAKYQSVNGAWPVDTNDGRDLKPTPQEATAACRRLYRFAMKRAYSGRVVAVKGRRRGGFFMREDRSGKRMIRTIEVNPDRWGGGWHEVVHMMSHRCAFKLYPGRPAHSTQHAFLERQMIEHVVSSGWLDGKLKRPEKPKVEVDVRKVRYERIVRRAAAWEAKRRRADAALKKLARQRAYYERAGVRLV